VKLGEALCDMGRLEEGLACLDEAVMKRPDDSDAFLHRGQALLTQDNVVGAINDLRRALALSTKVSRHENSYHGITGHVLPLPG
jgi:Flp pilus assembly protein TadD